MPSPERYLFGEGYRTRRDVALPHCALHCEIAHRGTLHGADRHVHARAFGGQAAEHNVLCASTDHDDPAQIFATVHAGFLQQFRVACREAMQQQAHHGRRVPAVFPQRRQTSCNTLCIDATGHLTHRHQGGIVDVQQVAGWRHQPGRAQQVGDVPGMAAASPALHASLQNPHAVHALVKAGHATHGTKVGEVISLHRRCVQRGVHQRAHQRPRSATDVRPVVARLRDAGNGGSGVVTCRSDQRGILQARQLGELAAQLAQQCSRWNDARGMRPVELRGTENFAAPFARMQVDHLRVGGVRVFRNRLAAPPVQQILRQVEPARWRFAAELVGVHLVQGVDRLLLNARDLTGALHADVLVQCRGSSTVALIPIAIRLFQHLSRGVQADVIHRPAIHGDGVDTLWRKPRGTRDADVDTRHNRLQRPT